MNPASKIKNMVRLFSWLSGA